MSTAKLSIRRFTLGPWETNCYVVLVAGHPGCWVVDASFVPAPLIAGVRESGCVPEAILLTHAHVDHIAGVAEVRRAFPKTPIVVHSAESAWLADPMLNLSGSSGHDISAPGPDRELQGGEALALGPSHWNVLHVPGHSPGSVAFHCPAAGILIGGDALFAGSIGRTDLPGGDHETLLKSIREKFYGLPGETRVLPGHGPPTTIAQERVGNPFVRG